ncbi:MAG: hypothetical protein ACE5GY_07620 [Thermodesulfobacteriota bacterium]
MDRRSREGLEKRNAATTVVCRAARLLALPAALLVAASGYLVIWSVSPAAPLDEVLWKTRLGMVLTIAGGALVALWLYRSSK